MHDGPNTSQLTWPILPASVRHHLCQVRLFSKALSVQGCKKRRCYQTLSQTLCFTKANDKNTLLVLRIMVPVWVN